MSIYGVLAPHSDGNQLSGKVVRINLKEMVANASACALFFRTEFYDHTIYIIQLTSLIVLNEWYPLFLTMSIQQHRKC